MVFTYEDKIIIKYIRVKYKHGAKQIVKDHPEFQWNVNGVKKLIKKIDETGSVERRPGSGRPKSARTEENIAAVNELILSQEDEPGTHRTPAEISLELDIAETSVRRIISDDLELRPLKKIKAQCLSPASRNGSSDRNIYTGFIPQLSWRMLSSVTKKFSRSANYTTGKMIGFMPQRTIRRTTLIPKDSFANKLVSLTK